ncbi:cytochrome c [Chthoniobacter flavus]|uniref:PSD1 and planctomycete cytochrome C domain-containing protein n=1 Tax=Chthoniobacter flavus TaxID=191863 RepID=UPI00104C8E35|nr:PSD1 and planctomycete cytochrome C domain-containing protein [Chthoniobacter flavus]TCO91331.1 cytochrome c [Chthoniobacter flavus]
MSFRRSLFPQNRAVRLLATSLFLAAVGHVPAAHGEKLQFNRDIRPILSDNCFACHGTDSKKREAGLRLDIPESAFKANDDGDIAITPGDIAKSEVWQRIISDDKDDMMPPPKAHKTLTAGQKDTIKHWIEQGAKYQKHWAFEAPLKPPVPELRSPNSDLRNPIDAFIDERLQKEGLTPSPEADRETLLRRVTFDLSGLPPTPAETDAFLADKSPDAYDKVVDRLLANRHYGEHMAHYWLDQARYGDTHGLHLDNERSMWPYRDWVVDAYNRNLPFDQFTIDQVAGDLIPNATREQIIASGFNRCNVTTSEGGSIDAEYVFRYAVDRTATTVNTWLGLTAQCAVCHDHKFDPISQKEFYQLYSFFHSTADPAMDGNKLLTPPILKLTTPEQARKLAESEAKISSTEKAIKDALTKVEYTDPATAQPRPPIEEKETVWLDDDFPAGAKPQVAGDPIKWVTAEEGPVFSGKRALKRIGKGMVQDFYSGGAAPLEIPPDGKLFAYVYLDPTDPPKAVMLQYHKGDWLHRAVWGDYEAIQFGKANTTERVNMGALPNTGLWTRLEVDAEKLGLKPGDLITGLAYTQFDGTVYWDKAGVSGRIDPAANPTTSQLAWEKLHDGKNTPELPADINKIFRGTGRNARNEAQKNALRDYYLANVYAGARATFEPLDRALAEAKKERDGIDNVVPATLVMADMPQPRDSFIMIRGQYDKPGEQVHSNVPAMFPPLANATNPTRLDLARWLVAPENPLTARVTVNRLWQQFFGIGIVKTSADFGSQGEPPSHPELLDWLAVTFRESGWDVKALVRRIVTSATYRQSSAASSELWKRDPENRLLARGPRFRLDAEEIRDNALYVSGLLVDKEGGKGARTYQPPNIWEPVGFVGSNTREYKQDHGEALYRRTLYCFLKRTAPPPFMTTFDAPSREQFCTRRERSDTPLQALQLMNDVQHFESARALAGRILTEGGESSPARITWAFRTVVGRHPNDHETLIIWSALEKHLARYQKDPAAAKAAVHNGESTPPANLPEPELAAWTLVANLLLNLDETVTKN